VVADAIVRSPLPVVAAIGPEIAVTIAELVADERAATPTQAAMKVTPDTAALLEQLAATGSILRTAAQRVIRERAQRCISSRRHMAAVVPARLGALARRLEGLATRLEGQRPAAVYERRAAAVEAARARLVAAVRARLDRADLSGSASRLDRAWGALHRVLSERVNGFERQLGAVGPMAVLKRGYSVTTRSDGSAIRSADEVGPGDRITTRVAEGTFGSTVDASATRPSRGPPRAQPMPRHTPEMDLFGPPG
jgi:exodeoxyribonuclease VII large subunit